MRKKIFFAAVAVITITFCLFVLSACGNGATGDGNGAEHEHSFAKEWSYDETNHWLAATCKHVDEVKNKDEHIFGGNGCIVCGYKKVIVGTDGLSYRINADGNGYTVIGKGTAEGTSIVIASEYNGKPVTGILDYAFAESTITSLTIPDSVTSIGSYAFCSCNSLASISIPSSVISVGSYAFYDCPLLKNEKLPDTVTNVGKDVFGQSFS